MLHRKVDRARNRGTVGKGTRRFDQRIGEFASRLGAVDQSPVDDYLLGAGARPFYKAKRDPPVRARLDRLDHPAIVEGGGIAVALKLKFGLVDAAGYVRG